jgi:hypothetical protein
MLPNLLDDFGISLPVYLRKIDKKSHWNPENLTEEERVEKVANRVFNNNICSLWYIGTNEDFYGVVAAISASRNPRQQDIDFVYLTENDLDSCQIVKQQTREGKCLFVEKLHYNIQVDRQQARNLCRRLISINREPQRCKKKFTQDILEYQEQQGCKATDNNQGQCHCELLISKT